ncbi:MAG: galK [Ilumatobacteraceae bacterium]|nr:galK [Ilumatobacteraceae bacterium]
MQRDRVRVRAPGRVNLIGDHTDHTGGLVLPMAIDRWTVIEGVRHDGPIELTSTAEPEPASIDLLVEDARAVRPAWARFVAAVAIEMGPMARALRAAVATDIPLGAGLSSSAALEVSTALALGYTGDERSLAELCRRAEHRASGVPCGIMDQLCITAGRAGHALLIDCTTLDIDPVELPDDLAVIVRFVQHRTLDGSEYATRVAQCESAEALIGPLRRADLAAVGTIGDETVRRRARHVVTENQRVRDFADALRRDDRSAAGASMTASHASLRDDFATSTAAMDAAVLELAAVPGVHGARMTGGGFGGCVVAIADARDVAGLPDGCFTVRAVDGAVADPFNT